MEQILLPLPLIFWHTASCSGPVSWGCVCAIWDVLDSLGCAGRWLVSTGTSMNARMPAWLSKSSALLFVLMLWLKDELGSYFIKFQQRRNVPALKFIIRVDCFFLTRLRQTRQAHRSSKVSVPQPHSSILPTSNRQCFQFHWGIIYKLASYCSQS